MSGVSVKSVACGSVVVSALLLAAIQQALASDGGTDTSPPLPLATPALPVSPLVPVPVPTSLPLPLAPTGLPTLEPSLPPLSGGPAPDRVPNREPGASPASPSPSASASVTASTVAFRAAGSDTYRGSGAGPKAGPPPIGGSLPGPVALALLVGLAALPVLALIFLLAGNRVAQEAWRMRDGRLRRALASELDLRPRELAGVSPGGLHKLREQVTFDELTGALRRVAGIAAAEREIARARRSQSPLAAVFVDVDGLKQVNDSRGHTAGDALLKGVAATLQGGLRRQDLVFRYGGDEFVCLLTGVGRAEADLRMGALKARASEQSCPFTYGLTELREDDDLVSFLARADQELYAAKAGHGRGAGTATVVPVGLEPSRGWRSSRLSRPPRRGE